MLTKIFFSPLYGGKFHRADLTGVALCSGAMVDLNGDTIHYHPAEAGKPHPILCKRCLAKS